MEKKLLDLSSLRTQTAIFGASALCAGACMFSVALIARMWVSGINLYGLAAGCIFACANLFFYRLILPGLLLGQGLSPAWLFLGALLKLPLLLLLIVLLVRQSPSFIASAVAGSLLFIPAAFIAVFIIRRLEPDEPEREDAYETSPEGDQNSGS